MQLTFQGGGVDHCYFFTFFLSYKPNPVLQEMLPWVEGRQKSGVESRLLWSITVWKVREGPQFDVNVVKSCTAPASLQQHLL